MRAPFFALAILLLLLGMANATSWYFPTWSYKTQINITSNNPSVSSNFVYNLTFDSQTPILLGSLNNTCSDLRFTYYNDTIGMETEISHFLYADVGFYNNTVGKCAGGSPSAVAFLKIPTLYANNTPTILFMYYGSQTSVVSNSSANDTLLFYDSASTYDANQWNRGEETGGILSFPGSCTHCTCDIQNGVYYLNGITSYESLMRINNATYNSINFFNSSVQPKRAYFYIINSSSNAQIGICAYREDKGAFSDTCINFNGLPNSLLMRLDYNGSSSILYRMDTGAKVGSTMNPSFSAPLPMFMWYASAGSSYFGNFANVSIVSWFTNYPNQYQGNIVYNPSNTTNSSWWNTSWGYRKQFNITNLNSIGYTNFVLNLTFDSITPISIGKMQSTCSDVRFTYLNPTTGLETEIPYFLYGDVGFYNNTVGKCAGGSASAVAFLKIPNIWSGINATTIYVYYGNPTATSLSNPNSTFYFWDDGSAGYNSTFWQRGQNLNFLADVCTTETCTVSGNEFILSTSSVSVEFRLNNNTFTSVGYFNSSISPKRILWLAKVTAGAPSLCVYQNKSFTDFGCVAIPLTSYYSILKADYNGSNVFTSGGNIAPTVDRLAIFMPFADAGTNGQKFTNVSILSWMPMPPIIETSKEENGSSGHTFFNFSIFVYDANTYAQIYFNASISNSTTTIYTPNTNNYFNLTNYLPLGAITINPINASYYSQIFYSTNDLTPKNLSYYLYPKDSSYVSRINFHIQNFAGVLLAGATITAKKLIGTEYIYIGQCVTDSSGSCYIYLDITTSYQITFEASGYTALVQNIIPSNADYQITLVGGFAPTYVPILNDIYISFSPEFLNNSRNWTVVNFTIWDGSAGLVLWGLNITYQGVVTYSGENTVLASGGSVFINISTQGRTNNVTAIAYWKRAASNVFTYTKIYFIGPAITNQHWSLTTLRDVSRTAGGGNSLIFVTLLFAMIATAVVTRFVPIVIGGGIVALVTIWIFLPFAVAGGYIFATVLPFLAILAVLLLRLKGRV